MAISVGLAVGTVKNPRLLIAKPLRAVRQKTQIAAVTETVERVSGLDHD
jgi:hypothetical protein